MQARSFGRRQSLSYERVAERRLPQDDWARCEVQQHPLRLRIGPYKFSFFSNENNEPRDVHATRDALLAKFWLEPVALAKNRGFADHELNAIGKLVLENRDRLREAWDDHSGTRR